MTNEGVRDITKDELQAYVDDIFERGLQRYIDWREADLSGLDMRGKNLHRLELNDAILHNTNFYSAEMELINLMRADLTGAVLCRTDLFSAMLDNANLTDADLRGADVQGARLDGAILHGTIVDTPLGMSPYHEDLAIIKDASGQIRFARGYEYFTLNRFIYHINADCSAISRFQYFARAASLAAHYSKDDARKLLHEMNKALSDE